MQRYVLITLASTLLSIGAFGAEPKPADKGQQQPADGYALTLKQALELTLKNSPKLKSAEEQLQSAESSVSTSISGFLPTVEAGLVAGTFNDRQPLPGQTVPPESPRDRNAYEGQLVFRQNLFSGFKTMSVLQGARSERDAKYWQFKLTRAELIEELIVKYFTLQSLQKQLRAEEEIATLRERQFNEVKQRYGVGRATELERLQAEYATEAQKPQILSLKVNIDSTLLELAQLLGEMPAQRIILSDQLEQAAAALDQQKLPPVEKALEMAKLNNPTLRQLTAEVDKSKYGAGEVLSKHLPTLDFELIAKTTAGLREDIASADSTSYGGQVKLNIPLFSGLSSFSERHSAATRRLALEYDKQQRWNEIVTDLTKQYRQWELSKAKVTAERVNVRLTAQTIKTAEASYRNGRTTISDLLDSYAQDLTAKRNLAQGYLDQISAASRIKRLLGVDNDMM